MYIAHESDDRCQSSSVFRQLVREPLDGLETPTWANAEFDLISKVDPKPSGLRL
jgi:hypothetical protein